MPRLLDDSTAAFAAEVITRGPLSRAEIAQRLGLSMPSLTRIQQILIEKELVAARPVSLDRPSGGRPHQILEPSSLPRKFMGIKLTGQRLYAVRTSLSCQPEAWTEQQLHSQKPDAVMKQITEIQAQLCPQPPAYLGVSLGGTISADGQVQQAKFLKWPQFNAPQLLRAAGCKTPSVFINDVEGVARFEQWFGLGRESEDFSIVTIGAGIGHAVIHHGRILHPSQSQLGLIGHLPLAPDSGRRCWLGHLGCAASVLNLDAIVDAAKCRARQAGSPLPTLEEVDVAKRDRIETDRQVAWLEACLRLKIPAVRAVLEETTRYLIRLLAIVADISVADSVIVTGELTPILSWGLADYQQKLSELRDPSAFPIRVLTRPETFDFWAQGAAASAIRAWILQHSAS